MGPQPHQFTRWVVTLFLIAATPACLTGRAPASENVEAIELPVEFFVNAKAELRGIERTEKSDYQIPLNEPYSSMVLYSFHPGGETISPSVLSVGGNEAIVDWVLLELRSSKNPDTRVASRAALIRKDGKIVDVDGVSTVVFAGVPSGRYHMIVQHWNRFGQMAHIARNFEGGETVDFDFSQDHASNH